MKKGVRNTGGDGLSLLVQQGKDPESLIYHVQRVQDTTLPQLSTLERWTLFTVRTLGKSTMSFVNPLPANECYFVLALVKTH